MTASAHAPATGTTCIIGHRNPDADSICSAIAYAAFKDACGERGFVAARCGNSNARIDAILARFHHPLPLYLSDVSPRVRDLMAADVITVADQATCAEALDLIDRHDLRVLPVLAPDRRLVGTVSVFQLGHFFMPKISAPKLMRQVHTTLAGIVRALGVRPLHLVDGDRIEDLYLRIGAMAVASFWRLSEAEGIPAAQCLIIVGDRREIQEKSIELGVRALIISGNHSVDADVQALARDRGVSLLVSPYDTATTAWITRTAMRLERLIDRAYSPLHADTRIADVRRQVATASVAAFMVLDDQQRLLGVLSKGDVLRPPATRLVLVDHNELAQAVPGAGEVAITEIIDHHRLGAPATTQPILFINEPVGSTCTIVADLFRRRGLRPSIDLAGLMMAGLISDTLLLQSPTSTPKDAEVLAWLETHADITGRALADLIFSSGALILTSPAAKVVRSDFKIYEEESARFAVSQVEELGFDNFWQHARDLSAALAELRAEEKLTFAVLLVTDINTQNSLMLVKGDEGVIRHISYAHVEQNEIFDLPGIVSRKKQLIPYLSGILREMAAEGSLAKPGTPAPFSKPRR